MTTKEKLLNVVDKLRKQESKEKVYGVPMDQVLDILEGEIDKLIDKEA